MIGGDRCGQLGRLLVDLIGALLQPVLGQFAGLGAEGVGLDDVAAGVQVGGMDGGDDVGAGNGEEVVAAVVALVVVAVKAAAMIGRAHGAVEDQDLFALAPCDVGFAAGGHLSRLLAGQRLPAKTASSSALAARPCPMVKTWMPGTP